jgi:hypothetical protein
MVNSLPILLMLLLEKDAGRAKLKEVKWWVHLHSCSHSMAFINIDLFLVVIYASLSNAAELVGSNALEQ